MSFWGRLSKAILIGSLAVLGQFAGAAELKVLAPRSMWTVLKEIGPQFEVTSGLKLTVSTDIAATLGDKILQGEVFGVFITPPVQMNRVDQKLRAATRTTIAHAGIGVEVRAGAASPDISSVEAFKSALLDAKSIVYLKSEGTSGAYLHDLFGNWSDRYQASFSPTSNGLVRRSGIGAHRSQEICSNS